MGVTMKDTEREIERTRRYLEVNTILQAPRLEVSRQEKRKWRSGCGTGSMQDFQQMKSVEIWTISALMGINKALFPPNIIPKTE